MSTELVEVTKAVAEFDRVAAGLAELRQKYEGVVYDVTTAAGMKDAIEARRAIREPRLEVERIRKAAKAPILALGKKLDSEAARITRELETLEEPIHAQIKEEDARKERERQQKIEAEMRRVASHQEDIAELRGNRTLSAASGSALIAEHIADLEAKVVDDSFEEFKQQAEDAKVAGLSWLRELHAAAVAHEAEQERIRLEREELARLKAEQAKREAEDRARRDEEERKAKADREAEAARHAEQLRQQQEESERIQREKQALIDAENERVRAEQEAERERLAEESRQAEIERVNRETALQEIQSIPHQLLIADVGRAPYCKGGDLESYDWVIQQTEAWSIAEDRFGALTGMAQRVKDNTLAQLRERRADLEKRLSLEADGQRLAAERAELERREREQRGAQEAEARRIAAEQAVLERERREAEEARRVEAERREKAARRREALRKRVSTFTAHDIATVVAEQADVELSMIAARIAEIPHAEWVALSMTEQTEAA